jgi:cytochrome c-type biogenesis protein CcmE
MALANGTKIALGAALVGALAVLVMSDRGSGVLEYRYVDDFLAQSHELRGKEVQVHGVVVKGSVQKKRGGVSEYLFEIERGGKKMKVHYDGLVPDTFQEGGEVVLTGSLQDGSFESTEMTAKCPSKYEKGQESVVEPRS